MPLEFVRDQLSDNIIDSSKINDSAVTTSKIADDAITSAKIADNAVEDAAIASGITFSKLSAPLADFDLNNQKITNLATGTNSGDAVNFAQMNSAIASVITGDNWQNTVLDFGSTPPESPSAGDRYIVEATATGDWAGQENNIAEFDGSSWSFTVPSTGTFIDVQSENNALYYFGGSSWAKKEFEATTAGDGLSLSGREMSLDPSVAGDGLDISSGVMSLDLKVDSGLVIDSSELKILSDNSTGASVSPLNIGANGVGLKLDNSSIKHNLGELRVGDITRANIFNMFGGASADEGRMVICDGSNGPIFASYKVFEFTSSNFSSQSAGGTYNPLGSTYDRIVGPSMVFYNGALQTDSDIAVASNGQLTIQSGNSLTSSLPMRLVAYCAEPFTLSEINEMNDLDYDGLIGLVDLNDNEVLSSSLGAAATSGISEDPAGSGAPLFTSGTYIDDNGVTRSSTFFNYIYMHSSWSNAAGLSPAYPDVQVGNIGTIYVVATVNEAPFQDSLHINTYTVAEGDGQDAASWYRSRTAFKPSDSPQFTRGVKTLFWYGQEPAADVHQGLPRVELLPVIAADQVGPLGSSETLLAVAVSTNTANTDGSAKIVFEKAGMISSDFVFEKSYKYSA